MIVPAIGTERDNCENVMLISMSTLPYNPEINTYQIESGKKGEMLYFKSISQMEPHTKYVIYKLLSEGKTLDRIVVLESEKARLEKGKNWEGETATSIYRKRIGNYIGEQNEIKILQDNKIKDVLEKSHPETSITCNLKGKAVSMPEILTVDLENPTFFWDAVVKIREGNSDQGLQKNNNKTIDLYMDMQGGDRNSVAQMNAIVSLLERQGVTVRGRYANDFIPKRSQPLHTIRETTPEYRTYYLISAMEAFSRYGWGDGLKDYFKGSIRSRDKEGELIKAIEQASSAISKCNADGFDSAVRKIEKLKPKFENTEKITQMDVVYRDIEEDYAKLFGAEHRYVEQIRWCLDKKFLQQAFTIFEAKMPNEFVLSGMLYYMTKDASQEDRENFLNLCEWLYQGLPSSEQYKMRDLNHYLVKYYCNGARGFCDPKGILKFGFNNEDKINQVVVLLKEYRKLCNIRNDLNHATTRRHSEDGFFSYMKKKRPLEKHWQDSPSVDYEKEVRDFLDDWERLARQVPDEVRNNILDLS